MKTFLLALILTMCVPVVHATNYYFSSVSGDDTRSAAQAQNPATPWKSIDQLNAINNTLKPGDSVFFKRGDVFYGTMNVRSSGVAGNVIYYGAYGSGAAPVISGFTTLTNWTLYSGSIYYATLDMPNLQIVTVNGEAKSMGRYPNTGFLNYENTSGNTSITDNELPASPNWTGAEIVMRKYRFIIDRHVVTNHSGTVLTYSTSTTNGNNAEFLPQKGNGYFFQNHLGTLDQAGEWYYDNTAKRLYVHFGGSTPAANVVKASTKTTNASVEAVNYITLENLQFEGANTNGLFISYASNIIVQNCNFNNQGAFSIHGDFSSYLTVKGGIINTSFSNGIAMEHNADNCTIDGVTVNNTNRIVGTGRSGSGVGIGISVAGNTTNIVNNRVVGAGYCGIQFFGNDVLVEKNYIDTFCTLKDDGGGIYTYNGASSNTSSNRKIRNNIILNSIGAFQGAEAYYYEPFGKAAGIYLDEHVNNVEITNNTIANGDWGGMFLHNIHDNIISNNLIYNHRFQIHSSQYDNLRSNNTMTGNQYIAKQASQKTFYYRTFIVDNPSTMGAFNNNYYARPIDDNASIQVDNFWPGGNGTNNLTLAQWKSNYGQDAASQKSPVTFSSNIDANIRFEYNDGNATKIVNLGGSYVDVKNNQYAGSIGLAPFTGLVLLKTASTFLQNQVITFPAIGDKIVGDPSFQLNATSTSALAVSYSVVSGPATVSGNTVTITGVGNVVIEATQAGNGSYKPATPVQQSFQVLAPSVQTITFPVIANKKFGDAPFTLNATASSGLPVTYQVISGLAGISGNTVTLNGASISTVIIEATQAGNGTYRAAQPVRQSFTVARGTQNITFPQPADHLYSDPPFALTATSNSGLPVSYQVTSGNATVNGNMVTLTGVGGVWIAASQAGNADWEPAALVSQPFWISKGNQNITFPAIPNKVVTDAPFTLNATSTSNLAVSYRVVQGNATVSGNTVTITGPGTVYIEASQDGSDLYNPATPLTRSFTVSKLSQSISFAPLPTRTYGDAPFTLSATASSGLPITYVVVTGPVTINGNTVSINGAGTVTIRATQPGNATYAAAPQVSQTFVVGKASQTIDFPTIPNKTTSESPFNLNATSSASLAVSYRIVSGPATLSASTVYLTGAGTVVIEATQTGNNNYSAASPVQRSFTVSSGNNTKQNQTITFNALPGKTFGDAPFTLSASASSGLPVSFSVVSGPASVSGTTVTITGAGSVTIQASQAGDANYNPAPSVQQTFAVAKAAQSINFPALTNKTYGDPAIALNATASSGLAISYSVVSGPASVNGNTVTITGVGTVTIQATQAGNSNYNPATSVQQSFAVNKANQTITFGPLSNKVYGEPAFALGATVSSGLAVGYSIASGPATVNGNLVTITGVGTVVVQASQAGDGNYNAATSVQQSFTVSKGSQSITFGALTNKTYGDAPFSVNATASSALAVSFSIVSGPATINGNTITITGTGTVTIEASQTGDANYNSATPVQQSFTVAKGSQTINFPAIPNKTVGDAPFNIGATASSGLPVGFQIISGPATLNGNTVSITGTGTVVIEASQTGNANFNAATPVQQSFVVSSQAKQNQSITFPVIANKSFGDAPFNLSATASSGLPVSYSVVSGPATLNGSTVTITGAGAVTIQASQAGDGTYNAAAPVQQSFNIAKAAQSITFSALPNKVYGDAPFTLSATASSGLPVSFSIVSGPATLNGNTVTLTGTGTVTIQAAQSGSANCNAATPVQQSFAVTSGSTTKQPQTITFPTIADKYYGNAPFALNATTSSGLPVTYQVTLGNATVNGNMVTITGVGGVTIAASQPGDGVWDVAPIVSRSFWVSKGAQTITFPAIPNKTINDAPFALNANASSGLPITYKILSGPATVSGNMVTITGTGTVWVEASQPGDANYNLATAVGRSFAVTNSTTKQNQTISFPAIANKVVTDAPFALTATASSGLPVSYSVVSGPATVNGNTVTITGVGSVVIQATQAGNSTYNAAAPVQQSFAVNKANQTITFAPLSNKAYNDAPFSVNATASSNLPVSYSVFSGPATINGNVVTLTGPGTVTIQATQAGDASYNAATAVNQSFMVANSSGKYLQTITFQAIPDKYYGDAPFALSATASSGLPVTYQVTSGNATVNGNMVTISGTGSVWIAASQPGNATYEWAPTVSQGFWVSKGGQTITFPAIPNKAVGDAPFALNAAASSGLPVAYKILSGPATVNGNMVTVTGAGTVWVEASQAGDANYNLAASVGQSFVVSTAPNNTLPPVAAPATRGANSAESVQQESIMVSLYPNPLRKQGLVRVQVSRSTSGWMAIYDKEGRLVRNLGYRQFEKAAPSQFVINIEGLSGGTYFIRLTTGKKAVSQIFQVM